MIQSGPTKIDLNMMEQLREQMSRTVDFTELGIAAGVILIVLLVSYWIGKAVAKRIAAMDKQDEEHAPDRYERLLQSASKIARYAVAGILLLAARYVWDWQFFSEVLIGFALSFAIALSVQALLRALNLGFWTASAASSALFAMLFSNSVGGITPLSSLLDKVSFGMGSHQFSLLTVVSALLILIFLIALVRLGNRAVKLLLGRNPSLDSGQRLLGEKLALVALVVAAFFIGIDLLGIDLTAFAVFSGAFGLAIGFGLQKTFGNLIAGIILLWDRSIKPGDVIVVGDSFGWVNKIGIRAVSVLTRDGKEHLIPNENLMVNEVENWSYSSKNVRVRIPVGVSYLADMDKAEALMLQAASECARTLKRPPPNVWMKEFGESSVKFEILIWIKDPQEGVGNFRSEVLKKVWWLFKENNIKIPFPQRDIHVRNIPDDLLERIATKPRGK